MRELGLGLVGRSPAESRLLTDSIHLVLVPIEISGLTPAAGPTSGGTLVQVHGTGFLALAPYGGGLLCQFSPAGKAVLARVVSDAMLECEVPPAVRPARATLRLQAQDSKYHRVTLSQSEGAIRARTFTYYSEPVASQVFPSVIPATNGSFNLTVALRTPIDLFGA